MALVDLAPKSLSLSPVEIGNLPLYNQDFDDNKQPPREWQTFRDRMKEMQAVIFATPEYNRSVPGVLKNAIDVGSRPYGSSIWSGKPAGIVSVTPGGYGAFGANHHLRQSLVFLDMPAMQQPEAYLSNIGEAFDGNTLKNDKTRELLTKFITTFAEFAERHGAAREPARKSA